MVNEDVVLLVASEEDPASTVLSESVLSKRPWQTMFPDAHRWGDVRLWKREERLLGLDHIDRDWHASTGEHPNEVIFLSRHVASSGRPALTVHPIGVPHLRPDEPPPFGGRSGRCVPPNPRMTDLWRRLLDVDLMEIGLGAFERSLEVTHHGPWLTAPSLFLEIGSDATMWDHRGAADCLSELLLQSLEQGYTPGDRVVITLGGGHYAPRANRFGTEVEIGHMLANHSLRFGEDPEDGTWKQAVDAALEATRASYPDARVVAHVERKSFKGPQRRCLLEHLRTSDVPVVRSADLLTEDKGQDSST